MTPHVYNIFDTANQIDDKAARIEYLRMNRNIVVDFFLKWAYDPKITFALPEGDPPYAVSEHDAHGNIYHEIKRIERVFLTGTLPEMKDRQREGLFIGLLEYLDKDDAVLLIAVKDKKLPKLFKNLSDKFVKEAIPELF